MSCKFHVDFDGNREDLLRDIKETVNRQDGTFSGDINKGEFKIDKPFVFKAKYEFDLEGINISIEKKPFFITCTRIIKAVEDYIKNQSTTEAKNIILDIEEIAKKEITITTYSDELSTESVVSLSETTEPTEGYMLDDFRYKSDNYTNLLKTPTNRECSKLNIVTLGKWPETKTEWKTECTPPPIRICADVPYIYTRECTKYFYGEVCYPTDLRGDAIDCLKIAVAAALLAMPNGAAAAKVAFIAAIKSCAASKFGERAKEISFGTDTGSNCGSWGR